MNSSSSSSKLSDFITNPDITNLMAQGTINSGTLTAGSGSDVGFTGSITATKVWNAVWNDIADFQLLLGELDYGKCYVDTADGAKICSERCQMGVIGIASDTFGYGVGTREDQRQVPIGVCGWVLAYLDKEYTCGTPLTNDENGNLTEMTLEEKRDYPERIVALYKKPEYDKSFGPEDNKIEVKGRHWVKIKQS